MLRADGADRFRVRAYHEAARTVRKLRQPIADVLDATGRSGLMALPAIGPAIASRIEQMLRPPEPRSQQLSIFDVDDDADTEVRPAHVVRELFDEPLLSAEDAAAFEPPPIALLILLDARFRQNVEREAKARTARESDPGEWLASWRVKKGRWEFEVRFSSSRAAQRAGRTRDWVVLEWGDHESEQATVVTEYQGPLNGRRVVRGRERECLSYWARDSERRLAEARWDRTA